MEMCKNRNQKTEKMMMYDVFRHPVTSKRLQDDFNIGIS